MAFPRPEQIRQMNWSATLQIGPGRRLSAASDPTFLSDTRCERGQRCEHQRAPDI
jgi:hypothetical protein